MEIMQEFRELLLSVALCSLNGEPLLAPFLLARVRINLIADIEDDTPTVLRKCKLISH
jgi:hypothetical protein